jgi:hypothetical protein
VEYLQTPEWLARRDEAMRRALYRCQVCRQRAELQVHHRSYVNLGEELPTDLTVLCQRCHGDLHHGFIPGRPDDDGTGLYMALAYDVVLSREPTSVADLSDEVKRRCIALKIRFNPAILNIAVNQVLLDKKRGALKPPPAIPAIVLPDLDPPPSRTEAAAILKNFGVKRIRRIMPVRLVTQHELDRLRAMAIIEAEAQASIERCRALEAEVAVAAAGEKA